MLLVNRIVLVVRVLGYALIVLLFTNVACDERYATSRSWDQCDWENLDSLTCTGTDYETGVNIVLTTEAQKRSLSLEQRKLQCSCSSAGASANVNPDNLISPPSITPPKLKLNPYDLTLLNYDGDIDALAPDPVSSTDNLFKNLQLPEINYDGIKRGDNLLPYPPRPASDPTSEQIAAYNIANRKYTKATGEWLTKKVERAKQHQPQSPLSLTSTPNEVALQQQISALESLIERIDLTQSAEIKDEGDGVRVRNGIASLALGSKVGTTDFSLEVVLEENWEGLEFYGSGIVGIDLSKHRYDYNELRVEIRASQNSWAVFNSDDNQLESGQLWPAGYYAPLVKWGALGVTLHNAKLKHARFKPLL